MLMVNVCSSQNSMVYDANIIVKPIHYTMVLGTLSITHSLFVKRVPHVYHTFPTI